MLTLFSIIFPPPSAYFIIWIGGIADTLYALDELGGRHAFRFREGGGIAHAGVAVDSFVPVLVLFLRQRYDFITIIGGETLS